MSLHPATEHDTRARTLLADLRSTVDQLRATYPELEPALREMVKHVLRLQVHLRVLPGFDVDEERLVVIARCVPEVTTNDIGHSRAGNLWIDLTTSRHCRDRRSSGPSGCSDLSCRG